MPVFINHGYSDEKLTESSNYTLFYNPYNGFAESDWKSMQDSTGILGGSHAARRLAASIELAHNNQKKLNWTVHERGTAIFKEALRQCSKNGLNVNGEQTVFYANPTVNVEKVDQFRRAVGMKVTDKPVLMNDFSLHQGLLAGNWVSELAVSWNATNENNLEKGKGDVIANAATRIAIVGGGLIFDGLSAGTAGWAISVATAGLTNTFSRNANQNVIASPGDAIDHYAINPAQKMMNKFNGTATA